MPYRFNGHAATRSQGRAIESRTGRNMTRRCNGGGDLTVWVTPEAIAAWCPPRTGRRGQPRDYSDMAIETGHLLRLAFGRPWRQTEGLLRSLATLLGMDIGVPDHTTLSRRSPGLTLARSLAQARAGGGPVHVVIDATGLKVFGAGLPFSGLPCVGRGVRKPIVQRTVGARPGECCRIRRKTVSYRPYGNVII